MKTAVSIPDDLFRAAEQEAKRLGVSRSKLMQLALRAYLSRTRDRQITKKINLAIASYGDPSEGLEPILDASLRNILADSEWNE